jgi:WXG100 family type VII secretion target
VTAQAYSNQLESTFNSLPGWIQSPLRPIYEKMDEGLKWVAGNPEDLVRAGEVYSQLGQQIQQLTQQQTRDQARLNGRWTGDAYEAFTAKMREVEQKLTQLGESTAKTKEVLEAGARACVEGANAIIEIIVMVLSILLAEIAIGIALSVLSFGASLAAAVAKGIATCLSGLARILSVVQRVATILQKIAQVFQKIATIFREIKAFLEAIKALLAALKAWKQGAAWGAEKAVAFGAHSGAKAAVSKGLQYASGGTIQIPGALGSGIDAGQEYADAWDAAGDAERAAE